MRSSRPIMTMSSERIGRRDQDLGGSARGVGEGGPDDQHPQDGRGRGRQDGGVEDGADAGAVPSGEDDHGPAHRDVPQQVLGVGKPRDTILRADDPGDLTPSHQPCTQRDQCPRSVPGAISVDAEHDRAGCCHGDADIDEVLVGFGHEQVERADDDAADDPPHPAGGSWRPTTPSAARRSARLRRRRCPVGG